MCLLGAFEKISSPHFFLLWNPHRIFEINAAKKLKFGTLVGIYDY